MLNVICFEGGGENDVRDSREQVTASATRRDRLSGRIVTLRRRRGGAAQTVPVAGSGSLAVDPVAARATAQARAARVVAEDQGATVVEEASSGDSGTSSAPRGTEDQICENHDSCPRLRCSYGSPRH